MKKSTLFGIFSERTAFTFALMNENRHEWQPQGLYEGNTINVSALCVRRDAMQGGV